ncbi:hypothetical protein M413DRAFT_271782 [Hebeloma cylindrosporum]|uniref:Uncharacterized protein n=1 Tax=Hebeloma cylindrosporum TaxID=76867 RepID=A0A0C2YBP2_HEBCY|nr:hypothetical protein M413DRAFT_271782 [Hebeloma cylindrosporum h7]
MPPFVSSSSSTSNHLPPFSMQATASAARGPGVVPHPIPSIRLISATPSSTVISSSDAGNSTTSSSEAFARALEDSWDAAAAASNVSLPLAPKTGKVQADATTGKKRLQLVPKKSKLGIFSSTPFTTASSSSLSAGSALNKAGNTDFSDVVRRVGVSASSVSASGVSSASAGKGGPGFEIYVDPTVDPDIGEILVVKKRPSRVRGGLGGVGWGVDISAGANAPPMPMGEKTNVLGGSKGDEKEKEGGKERWWTIGRGRKDSKEDKEKEKDKKKGKENTVKMSASLKPVEYIHESQPAPPRSVRSRTPDLLASTFKLSPSSSSVQPQPQDTRARFNSLDSGLLLSQPPAQVNVNANNASSVRMRGASTSAVASLTGTGLLAPPSTSTSGGLLAPPTSAGFLAPPSTSGLSVPNQGQGQGSIALRAMRSVRSLARIGSWAQFGEEGGKEGMGTMKEKKEKKEKGDGTVGKKEGKEKKKSKKDKTEENDEGAKKSKSKSKTKSSSKSKDAVPQASTPRLSTSSFEVGALSACGGSPSRTPGLGESTSSSYLGVATATAQKKRSILGLGLPSSIRLPSVRSGSTASSVVAANTVGPSFYNPTVVGVTDNNVNLNNVNTDNNRLSVDSALNHPRPSSVLSNASSAGSSLRPISTTSTDSRLSRASSGASSVRWDEEGLETIRERRVKDKADKRISKESKHSVEGRRRGSLASVFPDATKRGSYASSSEGVGGGVGYPIVTIEEATVDGHGDEDRMVVDKYSGDRMDVDEVEVEADSEGVGEGNDAGGEEVAATPVKQQKIRTRPMSEQLLGRSRPKPVYEDDEGVISILDAATNDLAQLINILDLQATPGSTPNGTPLRGSSDSPSVTGSSVVSSAMGSSAANKPTATGRAQRRIVADSPLKKMYTQAQPRTLRASGSSSISSLRPYAQSRGYASGASNVNVNSNDNSETVNNATAANNAAASIIAKQIAPWSTLMQGLSPVKEKRPAAFGTSAPDGSSPLGSAKRVKKTTPPPPVSASSPSSTRSFKPGHKRTMTPAPEPEPEIAFQPLGLRPERRVRAAAGATAAERGEVVVGVAQGRLVCVPPRGGVGEAEKAGDDEGRVPSCLTFGSDGLRGGIEAGEGEGDGHGFPGEEEGREGRSLTPVFKRMQAQENGSWGRTNLLPPTNPPSVFSLSLGVSGSAGKRTSLMSAFSFDVHGALEDDDADDQPHSPLPDESQHQSSFSSTRRRALGMSGGTMGGSEVSLVVDEDDEDSDVPDELREILNKEHHEKEMGLEIPVFRASLTDHSTFLPKSSSAPFPSSSSSPSLSLPSPCPSSTSTEGT